MLPKALIRLQIENSDVIKEIEDRTDVKRWDGEQMTHEGYWIYLKLGWCNDGDTHVVHEYTVQDCLKVFRNNVTPCFCEECQNKLEDY